MLRFTKPALLLAAMACAGSLPHRTASAATEEKLSQAELLKLNECKAIEPDALASDTRFATVMRKASVTSADVEKMRRCEAKFNVESQKDPDCAAMIKKHPELVRGHGSLMSEESKPAPK